VNSKRRSKESGNTFLYYHIGVFNHKLNDEVEEVNDYIE